MKDSSILLPNLGSKIKKADVLWAVFNHLGCAVLGFLLCRTVFLENYAPFGISFAAACGLTYLPSAATGVFIGYFIPDISFSGFKYIAAMLAVIAVRFMLTSYKRLSENAFFCAFISFISLALSSAVTFSGENTQIPVLGLESIVCAVATLVISRVASVLPNFESGLTGEELGCLLICISLALGGINKIHIFGISLSAVLAVTLILIATKYGGALPGTISAISVGIVFYFSGVTVSESFLYAVCAMFSGLSASYGKYVQLSVFFTCGTVFAVMDGLSGNTLEVIAEILIGCIIFAVIPRNAGLYLGKIFTCFPQISVNNDLNKAVTMRLQSASAGLKDVKKTVDDVALRLEEINAPDFSGVLRKIEDEACGGCKFRMHCWETRKDSTLEAIFKNIKHIKSDGSSSENDFPAEFKGRCMRTASLSEKINKNYAKYSSAVDARCRIQQIRQAVTDQFDGISIMLSDMADEFSNGVRFDNSSALTAVSALKNIGVCADECSAPIDKYGRMKIEVKLLKSGDAVLNKRDIMKALSLSCERDFAPPVINKTAGETFITACERTVYKVDLGVAQKSAAADMCGDAYAGFYDGKGHFVMVLSDGMGTGGRAAVDGAMASGLMSRLIKSGFGYDCALKILNSSMLFKSVDESLATMDIASIDLHTGNTEFYKAGAAPTLVRRLGRSGKAVSTSMPVGILSDVEFDKVGIKLHPKDMLLLLSDGAVFDGTDWIREELERFKDGTAQDFADRICECAARRRSDGHADDITVMAAIINKAV